LRERIGRRRVVRVWLAAAVLLAAASAAPAVPRDDLAREVLRRVPEWPGTEVEVPLDVYEQYVCGFNSETQRG